MVLIGGCSFLITVLLTEGWLLRGELVVGLVALISAIFWWHLPFLPLLIFCWLTSAVGVLLKWLLAVGWGLICTMEWLLMRWLTGWIIVVVRIRKWVVLWRWVFSLPMVWLFPFIVVSVRVSSSFSIHWIFLLEWLFRWLGFWIPMHLRIAKGLIF